MSAHTSYVLEFGVRGGAHTENVIVPTRKLAEQLARQLVMVFKNDPHAKGAGARDWTFDKYTRRQTWQSSTHFVALSKLDGVPRGPAAAVLWRKPAGPAPELMADMVVPS